MSYSSRPTIAHGTAAKASEYVAGKHGQAPKQGGMSDEQERRA